MPQGAKSCMNITAEIRNALLCQSEFSHQSLRQLHTPAGERLGFQRFALRGLGGTDGALMRCKLRRDRQEAKTGLACEASRGGFSEDNP
jgi:hypothetical protein